MQSDIMASNTCNVYDADSDPVDRETLEETSTSQLGARIFSAARDEIEQFVSWNIGNPYLCWACAEALFGGKLC